MIICSFKNKKRQLLILLITLMLIKKTIDIIKILFFTNKHFHCVMLVTLHDTIVILLV